MKDVDFHGCTIKKNDRIVFATSSAGRDAAVYPDADEFRVDRDSYRHIGSHFSANDD